MHYEQYYQVATVEKFAENGVTAEELCTCSQIKQANKVYKKLRTIDDELIKQALDAKVDVKKLTDFSVATKMYIRHLEFSNGKMQRMWLKAIVSNDFSMIPLKFDELKQILANEP